MSDLCFSAKVLTDSSAWGNRVVTMELTYPRVVHSEFMTHRTHSRNAASSRAIPVSKMMSDVRDHPFIPVHWGANQKGMQARSVLPDLVGKDCEAVWLEARDNALYSVRQLDNEGLHKQIANRLLEPWMWITVIATANMRGWNHYFGLRCHEDAEPHIRKSAELTQLAIAQSSPTILEPGDWHLPLTGFEGDEDIPVGDLVKVSVGRCARVSYRTHDGIRDPSADIGLHDRIVGSKHWSPTEHVFRSSENSQELSDKSLCGNLGMGVVQYRKLFSEEFRSE